MRTCTPKSTPSLQRQRHPITLAAFVVATVFANGPPGFAANRRGALNADVARLVTQLQQRGEPKAEIHLTVAGFLAKHGDKRARAHLDAARNMGVHPMRLALVEAGALRRQKRFEEAFATLLHILVKHPEQPYALVQLWKTAYDALLHGAAQRIDLDAVRSRLSDFGMHLPGKLTLSPKASRQSRRLTTLGYNAMLASKLRYAAELFEAAIDHLPSNARAHRGLGLARARQHDFLRSTGALLIYLELDPAAEDAGEVDRSLVKYWKRRHQ